MPKTEKSHINCIEKIVMKLLIVSLVIWIIILLYNGLYSFLPSSIQNIKWVKILAIFSACIILIIGVRQAFQDYQNYRFADISAKDGAILKSKSFPWKVTKTTTREGNTVFIINERYGDASEISIKLSRPTDKFLIYNSIDGVGIKFLCPEDEIPDFKIIISK